MTPSETRTFSAPQLLSKKMGNETVTRKASFKCPPPNKAVSQRIARKVVLPMSTVQALTCKFNELSQPNQGHKHKITQNAVKNILGVNGKPSTIKVVICRKPSTSRYKRPDDPLTRRRVNVRKFQSNNFDAIKENIHRKNVYQKVSEYEDMKKEEADAKASKHRTTKMQVPKILVDIDLGAENCLVNHKNTEAFGDNFDHSKSISEENSLSVRTAISIFEKSSKCSALEKIESIPRNKPTEIESPERQMKTENVQTVKAKPIAAIKPILKRSEDRVLRKTKLSPKDSLNRKKYVAMKRELQKENEEIGNSGENDLKPNLRIENCESKISNESNVEENVSSKPDQAKDSEKSRIKNSSSLHKHILQSSFTLTTNDILLTEANPAEGKQEEEGYANQTQNLKPNTSFLWSKKEELYVGKVSRNRKDLPLPVPPDNFVSEISGSSETIYDDVRCPRDEDSESEEFEKISESEEETYDDVRVYWPNTKGEDDRLREDVREKNILNEISNLKCSGTSDDAIYSYDDGEGERYQYISDKSDVGNVVSNQSELYQYIQSSKSDNNIYEDIQTYKTTVTPKDLAKDIYEDINCANDNVSVNNCYESVYNGIYSRSSETASYIKSDVSDSSNNSGRSTYEKSNSLYGITAGNVVDTERCLNLTEANSIVESSSYHLTLSGSACPNSETSQSNSDEWVEVSESESEGTVYLVQERPRKTKTGGNAWSQKERRRWKRLQRKTNSNADEIKLQNVEDHFYESVGQYENAEISNEENFKDQPFTANEEQIYNDDQFIDDFDSQSSEEEAFIDAKLPDVPNQGYNITKSLKAAGQKLRKNLSLRKSDLSKSLKRFKKSSRPKVHESTFAESKDVEGCSAPKSENPLTPANLNNSVYSNNSDSSSSSYHFTKRNSSSDIKNDRHRKSWTFRSKFKSNSLDTTENSHNNIDNNRNSTFYLSLNEVQPKQVEKNDDLLNEIQSVLSQRSSNSSDNVAEKFEMLQHSDSSLSLTKSRPNVPPPPPPALNKVEIPMEKTKYSDILWGEKATNNSLYVESGLFDKQKKHSRCIDSDASLYAEIGLYGANEDYNSNRKTQMFVDEPLYQFYTESVNQRARDDILNNYDSEGYEEINDYYSVINEKRRTIDIKNVRPNFEDFNDDLRPKISFRSISDRRTLWCQIPAVIDSCILETLTDQARKLQEAKFEILTSEGSYMNSLNVLESHFMKKVSDSNIIAKRDFRILFSNILSVKKCSESFLDDLENCWQNNIMLNGICDIVYKHSTTSFQVYTKYCKNQICIYRTLRELLDKNSNFENALKEIESDSVCQNLNIHSFLMLPMQRITRLPLLMGAVLARLDKTDDEYEICKSAFDVLNKIVQDCDDEARRMEKCEEMLIFSQQIEFPKGIRRIPILTGSRFLVKRGQVTQLVNRDENKLTFGKKFSKVNLTLFLFTDLLIIAKKKNIRNYVVVDHCPRNLVQMQTTDGLSQLPVKLNTNSDMGGKLLMLLTMLENHEKKTVEMILSFEMESDRQRWLDAVTPKLSENPNESIYEEWDCPQVIALYEFTPTQPDELNLCIGDVVNVLKKMNDGWYQGERLRDGARGWFPQNHTQEISSSHVRAKNKKLRYKLLALSGNLIDSQKMNGK